MAEAVDQDWIALARDATGGVEAVRAHFRGHAYDPHFHDEVLIGVTEQGVQQFRCRRAVHRSTRGRVILIAPGETHDGVAPEAGGFTYSMLYLDPARLAAAAAECTGRGHCGAIFEFAATLADDADLAAAILSARRAIAAAEMRAVRDATLDRVVERLARHVGLPGPAGGSAPATARRAREAIDALHGEADLGLERLAALAGTDRFRLARAFQRAYGLAPHAYLVNRRLCTARGLLARGLRPAEVAAAAGFADQSHLGRWFRRAYGITPAGYRRICTNVPDRA
ncbi:AraC family transcriptional regulator [Desertibaculum subflavum]|uniref:AraC family transcriptional regulator n=1 Tax=Desertibaculum subflavum TaxID=2268458 RepID=UPI000E674B4C